MVVDAGDGGFGLGLYYAGPGGVARRVKGTDSACPGCEWQVTLACDGNHPDNEHADNGNCIQALDSCPGALLHRVWLRRPGSGWLAVDTICIPLGSRLTDLRDLAPDVAEAFRHLPLPAPRLQVQPRDQAVVGIPSIFYAAAETERDVELSVEGFTVRLTAEPASWTWTFGDRTSPLTTDQPGAPYPDHTISHTYRTAGPAEPAVQCEWTASYVVAGTDAVVPVDETVSRTATAPIVVREARAELVAGP